MSVSSGNGNLAGCRALLEGGARATWRYLLPATTKLSVENCWRYSLISGWSDAYPTL